MSDELADATPNCPYRLQPLTATDTAWWCRHENRIVTSSELGGTE